MDVSLPEELCELTEPAEEVKDTNKKITYIPSNFRKSEVETILRKSRENATTNWNNPVYRRFKLKEYIVNLLTFAVYMLIVSYFVKDYNTLPKFYKNIILMYGHKAYLWQVFTSLLYVLCWGNVLHSIRRLLTPDEGKYRKYVENGEIIEDKYELISLQISIVYDNMERFIDFYKRINDDSKYIYSINEADETLVVEYPQQNESGQETFYLGPWISKIVDEKRGIIDFSKLDELYQLI